MNRLMNSVLALIILLAGIGIGLTVRFAPDAVAQGGCRTFTETGKTVCGRFLQYWQQNGGLAQQGFPLSGQFTEVSDLNGKTYTVQYFERAVFELHPENQAPNDVLLSQLGTFQFKRKYPNGEPVGGATPTPRPAPQPPAIVGQVIEVNEDGTRIRVTVRSVQEVKELKNSSGSTYRARGKFVVLFITVANLGGEAYLFGSWGEDLRLLDDKERRYRLADLSIQEAASEQFHRESVRTEVEAGKSAEEVMVFDTETDATNYKLVPAQASIP